jgi:hypothetical protein
MHRPALELELAILHPTLSPSAPGHGRGPDPGVDHSHCPLRSPALVCRNCRGRNALGLPRRSAGSHCRRSRLRQAPIGRGDDLAGRRSRGSRGPQEPGSRRSGPHLGGPRGALGAGLGASCEGGSWEHPHRSAPARDRHGYTHRKAGRPLGELGLGHPGADCDSRPYSRMQPFCLPLVLVRPVAGSLRGDAIVGRDQLRSRKRLHPRRGL